MKNQKLLYAVLWIALVSVVVFLSQQKTDDAENPTPSIKYENSSSFTVDESVESVVVKQDEDIKGAWVSYISLNNVEGTKESFESRYLGFLEKAINNGITDLFVHVRAFSDALYPSEYFPWSHLLTGVQGQDPGYDPLAFMLNATHEAGMKFHAWINPMRVSLSSTPSSFSIDNVYNIYSDEKPYYFFEKDGAIYINPAYAEMRNLIADGAAEIVQKYDVDGIHFDDYFYPSDMGDLDKQSYEMYCQTTAEPLSIEKWRETNINTMIANVYREIKNANDEVAFGISPQGNNNNNLALGANVETWCSTNGYVDYICPQIYFSYENPSLSFGDCLDFWINLYRHDKIKLYIGLANYKVGTDADAGTWLGDETIIERQKEDSFEKADGYVLYEIGNIK